MYTADVIEPQHEFLVVYARSKLSRYDGGEVMAMSLPWALGVLGLYPLQEHERSQFILVFTANACNLQDRDSKAAHPDARLNHRANQSPRAVKLDAGRRPRARAVATHGAIVRHRVPTNHIRISRSAVRDWASRRVPRSDCTFIIRVTCVTCTYL